MLCLRYEWVLPSLMALSRFGDLLIGFGLFTF